MLSGAPKSICAEPNVLFHLHIFQSEVIFGFKKIVSGFLALLRLKNTNDEISNEEFINAWRKEIENANQDESIQLIQPQELTLYVR
jgi:hypothetical protein